MADHIGPSIPSSKWCVVACWKHRELAVYGLEHVEKAIEELRPRASEDPADADLANILCALEDVQKILKAAVEMTK